MRLGGALVRNEAHSFFFSKMEMAIYGSIRAIDKQHVVYMTVACNPSTIASRAGFHPRVALVRCSRIPMPCGFLRIATMSWKENLPPFKAPQKLVFSV